jgi:hypothetical protein
MNANRAQGTIEYLVIIAVVVVISLVAVGLISNNLSAVNVVNTSGKIGSISSEISLVDAATDDDGNFMIGLSNNSGGLMNVETITVTDGENQGGENFEKAILVNSGSNYFKLSNLENICPCSEGQDSRKCTFQITYHTEFGLLKTEEITTTISCVRKIEEKITLITPAVTDSLWAKIKLNFPIGDITIKGIAIDANNNSYVAGHFGDATVNFGQGIVLTKKTGDVDYVSDYDNDFFVAKYSSDGNIIWAKGSAAVTQSPYIKASSVSVDLSGNVYVAGNFDRNMNAWPEDETTEINFGNNITLLSEGYVPGFVVKYNQSGTPLWAARAPLDTGAGGFMRRVKNDINGNVYLMADFIVMPPITSSTLSKFNPAGTLQWEAMSFGFNDMLFDNSQNPIVFSTYNSLSMGYFGDLNAYIFMSKFRSLDGNQIAYYQDYNLSETAFMNKAYKDNLGNIYVLGEYSSDYLHFSQDYYLTNPFPSVPIVCQEESCPILLGQPTAITMGENFIAKFDSNMNIIWARNIDRNSVVMVPTAITGDAQGNIYFTGWFTSNKVNFGNEVTLEGNGITKNYYIVKLNSMGEAIWAKKTSSEYDYFYIDLLKLIQ